MNDPVQDLANKIAYTLKEQADDDSDQVDRIAELNERIADLKRQLEVERSTRVWHANSEVEAQKRFGAARYLADKEIEKAEHNRRISINRLRRAKAAEAALVNANERINFEKDRADFAEATVRAQKRTLAELREALAKAVDDKETYAATWRIKAEEWEEKYKEAVETEGKKWETAVDTWRKRYDDAMQRIYQLREALRRAGGDDL